MKNQGKQCSIRELWFMTSTIVGGDDWHCRIWPFGGMDLFPNFFPFSCGYHDTLDAALFIPATRCLRGFHLDAVPIELLAEEEI